MRKILEQKLDELKKENMMKEQKLIEIQKWKTSMLGEVHELEEQFAARVGYLFLHCIFSCIFWHFQVFLFIGMSYLYMYFFSNFVSFIFFIFLIEKVENMF